LKCEARLLATVLTTYQILAKMPPSTNTFLFKKNATAEEGPPLVLIESSENTAATTITTQHNFHVDVDTNNVYANANANVDDNGELFRMKEELSRLRRDRDHWRESALTNLAIETSTLMMTTTTTTTARATTTNRSDFDNGSNSSNVKNNTDNDNHRKRGGDPFGYGDCHDNNLMVEDDVDRNLKSTSQSRLQYSIPATTTATAAQQIVIHTKEAEDEENAKFNGDGVVFVATCTCCNKKHNKENPKNDKLSESVVAVFDTTTTTTAPKRQKIMNKSNTEKSSNLMDMKRHLKSAMIYASKGDKNLMLYSIKHAEYFLKKNHSSSPSSCNETLFLDEVARIQKTINKDLENLFHKNTTERQLRSAMAYAIRGDKSTVEYLLKEAEINAQKFCHDGKNDDKNIFFSKIFQERVTKIREEMNK